MLDTNDRVPTFEVKDDKAKPRTFPDLAGEKGLVLFFYPKDLTPG